MATQHIENTQNKAPSSDCVKTAIHLLMGIVETACEHESDLELMRLVNFMDLYRTYLAHVLMQSSADEAATSQSGYTDVVAIDSLVKTQNVSFEQFISDSRLLKLAAEAASQECGIAVAVPPPLKFSANADIV